MMKVIPFLTVSLLVGVVPVAAATIPYTNDFSGTGDNTAFTTETPDSDWTVANGVYRYVPSSTSNDPSAASLSITNATGKSFTLQTQFTVSSVGTINGDSTFGFGFFGSDAAFTGSTSKPYYLADLMYATSLQGDKDAGRVRIRSLGDSADFTNSNGAADDNAADIRLAIQTGTTYTLKLVGTYSGGTLDMTFGLFDAAGTTQIGTSATASDTSPLTGTNWGYRNRDAKGGGTTDIAFDNYSITVPEPATLALMGLGGLVMLSRRRRG